MRKLLWAGPAALLATGLALLPRAGKGPERESAAERVGSVRSLDVRAGAGCIHLLVLCDEQGPESKSTRLVYARADEPDGRWSQPSTVARGDAASFCVSRRGNDVRIAAAGKTLLAAWQTSGSGYGGRGPARFAASQDGGKSWAPVPPPPAPDPAADQGFLDLAGDPEGGFHAIWLDNRSGKKGLRYARLPASGSAWEPVRTVDDATCMCCWNALARGPDGALYALYRDDVPRDMALAALPPGASGWEVRGPAGRFGWEFEGCPHAGGGLAAVREGGPSAPTILHALVWTAKDGKAGVHYLRSFHGGRTWEPPAKMGRESASHPDLAARGSEVAAVWSDGCPGGGEAVYGALSRDGGRTWSGPVRFSAAGAQADHPRVVRTDSGFRVFWTEVASPGSPARWRSARWEAGAGEP